MFNRNYENDYGDEDNNDYDDDDEDKLYHSNIIRGKSQSITLQIGNYSNFVGSHLWNIREDHIKMITSKHTNKYDHELLDVSAHYRIDESKKSSNLKHNPRVVMIDCNSNFYIDNEQEEKIIEKQSNSLLWDGHIETIIRNDNVCHYNYNYNSYNERNDDNEYNSEDVENYDDQGYEEYYYEQQDNYDYYKQSSKTVGQQQLEQQQQQLENELQEEIEEEEEEEEKEEEEEELNLFWSSILDSQIDLHNKTICELPTWIQNENFDNYLIGKSNDVISKDLREDYIDKIRNFAEECDYLRSINILSDFSDGFGGLTSNLMQEIREEFPSAIIPVWGFTTAFDQHKESENVFNINNKLRNLGLSFAYSDISEYASMIIPISPNSIVKTFENPSESSLIIAAAIECSMSFQHLSHKDHGDDKITISDWFNGATNGGRFSFCNSEVCLPFNTPLPTSPPSESLILESTSTQTELWNHLNKSKNSKNKYLLNPFSTSLSSANVGFWAVSYLNFDNIDASREEGFYTATPVPAYSNMLSIRGCEHAELNTTLFKNYRTTGRLLTNISQLQTPLYIKSNRRHKGKAISFLSVGSSAAVGANESMGRHITKVANSLTNRSHSCNAQLDKYNINAEDCNEIVEKLLDKSKNYDKSSDF